MITQFHWQLESIEAERPLTLTAVTAAQLHGLVFRTILPAVSDEGTTWLHDHPNPKPYTLAPLTDKAGQLTGLRLVAFDEPTAALLRDGAVWAQAADPVRLAEYDVRLTASREDTTRRFIDLLAARPKHNLTLRFLTPTAFKQGPRRLHLPLPVNVFARPLAMWQQYAPGVVQIPADWLEWCETQVYAQRLGIHTIDRKINSRGSFTGFVGTVQFVAVDNDVVYLRLWQALGRLTSYCGVGSKTTMGLGAVAWAEKPVRKKDKSVETATDQS